MVVAAGSGTRLAAGKPKAFVEVAGRTILEWSLEPILAAAEPFQIVVVVPVGLVASTSDLLAPVVGAAGSLLFVVAGGDTRQSSVAAGLAAVAPSVDTVLVHDTARCFTPTAQFDLVTTAVRSFGHGVVPGLPVSDTIKKVTSSGLVAETVDRAELVAMQTPQGFPRAALDAAYAAAEADHTDDAALFASAGHDVTVVAGDPAAFKITTPWDLQRAETIARQSHEGTSTQRVGIGIDVHAFATEPIDGAAPQPMRLGTLDFPGEIGLAGHSDGDAVAHALVDALLSAAGLGDIGSQFGTDRSEYAGAPGDVFLTATLGLLHQAGASVVNVALQVVGNRPRLAKRRVEMEERLTRILRAPVSVSATTTDGLGFTGRSEGVTVIATALVTITL